MGEGAVEVIGFAGFQDLLAPPDGDLDPTAHDDPAFLALVSQHVLAGIGAGCVDLVHDRHRAFAPLTGD